MSVFAQIWIIAKLEIRRAFFSRRALWVYLLALFPGVIFIGHGIETQIRRQRWTSHGITDPAILQTFSPGLTDKEVLAKASDPLMDREWETRRRIKVNENEEKRVTVNRRTLGYFDGRQRVLFEFEDGKLVRTGRNGLETLEEDRNVFAGVFQYFYLRLAVFFGCLGIFINLFRGEMLDKSLHFWFLAPVRRDVLLLGKYCAGLIASAVIFSTGTLLSFIALVAFQDKVAVQAYWSDDGPYQLGWYLAATALGCVGYGSVFLAAGLLLRNPIIPAVVMLLWESINGFLPDLLQKLSVLHYLQSICPVPAPMDSNVPPLLRMLLSPAAPSSAWVAILGLLSVTALVLWAATHAVRRLEINYGTE